MDFFGHDIEPLEENGQESPSEGECAKSCIKSPGCNVFTYKAFTTGKTECWLKTSDAGRWHLANSISGNKIDCIRTVKEREGNLKSYLAYSRALLANCRIAGFC